MDAILLHLLLTLHCYCCRRHRNAAAVEAAVAAAAVANVTAAAAVAVVDAVMRFREAVGQQRVGLEPVMPSGWATDYYS